MKRYSKLFYALALIPFLALSCQEEEIYEAGEEDNSACYGVFFPEQDGVGAVELDPTDPTQKVIKVSRTKSEGEITVPIDLITKDPEGFWKVTELKFENGQEDTTIVLSFDDAEIGKAGYSVTLQISDPLYASKYSKNASYINYAPQRVKWNDVNDADGKNWAVFSENCVLGIFSVPSVDLPVQVQERDDQKGVYRLIEPYKNYNEILSAKMGEDAEIDYVTPSNIIINASDPDAVWLPVQELGIDLGYGPMMIGSKYAVYMELGDTPEEAIANGAAPRGKMVNGVITFPKDEICIWMPEYDDLANGWWYTKLSKFIIPGGVETDYSLELEVGEPNLGISEFTITGGADIDTVRYAAFTNTMKTAEIGDAAAAIRMGTIDGLQKLSIYEKGDTTVNVQFDTTGIFTIVAVGYDTAGVAQTTTSVEFGYLKNGDEDPVQLYADIANNPVIVKDSSSLAFSFLGRNITELNFDIFNKATFDADPMKALKAVMDGDAYSLDEDQLELVNTTGFTSKIGRLIPGTEFVLVWWAFNGYVSDYNVVGPAKTSGDALPIYLDYGWDEYDDTYDLTKAEDWAGTYNLYAYEALTNKSGIREYLGKVVIEKGEMPDTTGLAETEGMVLDGTEEWCDVFGLLTPSAKQYGHADSLKFMIADGLACFFNFGGIAQPALEGGENAISMCISTNNGKAYTGVDMSYFVPVADGYWALLREDWYYDNYGMSFDGIGTYICDENWAPYKYGMVMWDVLLVNAKKDDNGVAKSNVNFHAHVPFDRLYSKVTSFNVNCVESHPAKATKKSATASEKQIRTPQTFKALNFDIPSQPVKMTVTASPKSAPRQLATKGGQIRKQDARVRR
ncbi:MAG: hypothetical protein IJS07_08085 [Bacteroidales bacterium]|nr:hypothetical protein [Bacteroidales bacterium]